jgi:quercetin dioxygenase-like cupin family protein
MSLMLKAAFKGRVAMKGFSTIVSLVALIAVAPALVLAEDRAQGHVMVSPSMVMWQPPPPALGVPKGAELAVLSGDPSQDGQPFVVRLKLPAHYQFSAHWHPTAEAVTVLSGTINIGVGDQLDPAKAHALDTGGFVMMPAKIHHFAWTDTETVIQVHGTGPLALNYVNPADDPRQTQTSQ